MIDTTKKITESSLFQNFITAVILLTAVLVGLETYPSMIDAYGPLLHTLDLLILAIFVIDRCERFANDSL